MTNILEAKSIHKEFEIGDRTIPVLRGIDLDIVEREVLSIVGPSGAGKSTLLHILGLLETPTAGNVKIRGQEATELPTREQARLRNESIGFVFQFYHLFRDLNALENVVLPQMVGTGFFGYLGKRKRVRERARDLLVRVGLEERMTHRPSQLSGGERQRVAIARALMNEPELLLCDEPTGNLDTETGDRILQLLFDLNQTLGQTVVLVTHNEDVAGRAARCIQVVDGKVVDRETPETEE